VNFLTVEKGVEEDFFTIQYGNEGSGVAACEVLEAADRKRTGMVLS